MSDVRDQTIALLEDCFAEIRQRRNETIDECAKIAESYGGREGREIAVVIRTLKDPYDI